jgi:hypothetical protein
MIIHGVGPYDSDGGDVNDADRILTQFIKLLEDGGHQIRTVTLVTGSRVRNAVRERSGSYVLADAPETLREPGLDPAVTDPVAVQAEHDDAVAVHNEVVAEREAAEVQAEQDAVTRHRDAAADRAEQDEAIREHFADIREQDTAAGRHQAPARYAAGGVIPAGYDPDEASRREVADAASAALPPPVIP